jgi:hypothetical protein
MSTVVALATAGDTAVSEVAEALWNDSAGLDPNSTWVTLVRLEPVTVTVVSPEVGPKSGLTLWTAGSAGVVGGARYVNASAVVTALTAAGVVTVTSTVPAADATGEIAGI